MIAPDDKTIRARLVGDLAERLRSGDRLVSEMSVWNGSARADLAVISDRLHGYEIKSDRDTLARLRRQVDLYGMVFDTMTIVCGEGHLRHIVDIVPPWWGIKLVVGGNAERIEEARPAGINSGTVGERVAGLLWNDEIIALLRALGAPKGVHRMKSRELHRALAQVLDADDLRAAVLDTIRTRADWMSRRDPLFIGAVRPFRVSERAISGAH